MKRLCVFYKRADLWAHKRIDWIVCKECQRKIVKGLLEPLHQKAIAEQKS